MQNNNFLHLPMILNKKVVGETPVYQIETAMGAAINVFEGAKAIQVPRKRFVPVKKTNELLALWSDAYIFDDNFNIMLNDGLEKSPQISLGDHYNTIDQMLQRIKSTPSLKNCSSLEVEGDVSFEENVIIKGKCTIKSTQKITLRDIIIDNEDVKN